MNQEPEAREGYRFAGWYADEALTKRINPAGKLPETMQLYPKWSPIYYPVTYVLEEGVNSRRNPKTVSIETGITKLYPAMSPGKLFEGWYLDGQKVDCLPEKVTGPITVEARFRRLPVIQFETGQGGSIQTRTADLGGMVSPFIPPMRMGFDFTGWFLDEECTREWNFSRPFGTDAVLHAGWKARTYPIHYELDGGVLSGDAPTSYTYDTPTIVLPRPVRRGYQFTGWTDPRNNPVSYIKNHSMGERTLVAHWQKKELELFGRQS